MSRLRFGVWAILIVGITTAAWALNIPTKFPTTAKAKIQAIVDEAGNVLFGSSNPGQVKVTNFPSGNLGASMGSQVISLEASSGSSSCPPTGFSGPAVNLLLNPDGSTTPGFTIPSGKVLVVTDASFFASAAAGDQVIQFLARATASSGNVIALTEAAADPSGAAVANLSLRGAIVKSGATLCMVCEDRTTSSLCGAHGTVQGFLADDL